MNVLVVGAGMYVLGRGTATWGTVLPSIAQASKQLEIDSVTICSTSNRGRVYVDRAAGAINRRLGTSLKVGHTTVDQALQERVDARFDCAIVSVPDHLHFEIGKRVLEANLHCLMVKPFVPSLAEGKKLVALARDRDLYGAVEFHKRFDESNLVVARMLREGAIGVLAYATVEYSQRIGVPTKAFAGWASHTNVFQYLGVHYVDLLYFLTGFRPTRVAAAGHRGILSTAGVDTYDSVHVLTSWRNPEAGSNEFVAQFAVGWIDPEHTTAMSDQRYVLVGSGGRIECDQKNRGLRVIGSGGTVCDVNPYFSEYLAGPGAFQEFSGYGCRSIERFLLDVNDLKRGRVKALALENERPTFQTALASTAVIEAVRRSLAAEGRWQEVDEAF